MPIQTYAQDATQGDNSLDPVEFLELPRVASVSASHDGRYLSYVLSAPDWAEDETVETLRILRCGDDGCAGTALNNLPESPETEAIWRPRSHQFVVVAEVEEEGGDQIHFFDPETGEASQVTNHPGGVRQVSWLPDGSALIYESDAEAEDDAANEWSIEPFGSADADALYRVDMTSGETSVVFASAGLIEGYSLSENGRYLIVRQRFDPVAEDRDAAELWRIDLRSGESRQLTDNRIRENGARLAPDGETFAYIASVNAGASPITKTICLCRRLARRRLACCFRMSRSKCRTSSGTGQGVDVGGGQQWPAVTALSRARPGWRTDSSNLRRSLAERLDL
ncbi:TolB family protein [Erythrobacter aureus]|nr:PD40 domain-containing protein [Erythrobacter aureus]